MAWWQWTLVVLALVVIPSYAVWKNMADGRGNNAQSTRNRGIAGERGDDYRDPR
jgi:hypothetical protein